MTKMLLKSAELRIVIVGMPKGSTWPEHAAAGRVVVRVEHGCVDLRTKSGDALRVEQGVRESCRARLVRASRRGGYRGHRVSGRRWQVDHLALPPRAGVLVPPVPAASASATPILPMHSGAPRAAELEFAVSLIQ